MSIRILNLGTIVDLLSPRCRQTRICREQFGIDVCVRLELGVFQNIPASPSAIPVIAMRPCHIQGTDVPQAARALFPLDARLV
jgi:hypothetical protein